MRQKIRNNPFARGPKNLLFIVFFFIVCLVLLTKLTDYTRQIKTISYSSFLKAVERDEVKGVHVSGQDVYGILKDGTRFETVAPENNPQQWDLLKAHNVDTSINPTAGQFSFWHMIILFFLVIIPVAIWYFFRQSKGSGGPGNIFNMGKSRAKLFTPTMNSTNFADVAGAQDSKQALMDIVDFLKNPEKYRRLGARIPRGVLLVGEPGNGKTLLAKAVAGEAHCPFFSVSGADFIEVFVGVGAARVRDLFEKARKNAPSIVFIDEIDAIGRQRGTGFGGGHDEREQTLNQLLTEMDGFETSNSPVIVIAATNMPDVLDKALLRPGRFDRIVNVGYPDLAMREQILQIHTKKIKIGADVNLHAIAQETAGFSGADLGDLVNKAALIASKKNKNEVAMEDLLQAHKTMLETNSSTSSSGASNPLTKGNTKPKMFMPSQVKVKFADVAGIPEAKEELQDVVDFLKNPEKYRRLGAKLTRGVMLYGAPGNGKTLLAKAVAGEANCPFFSVSASEFVEMYVGVGASRVRDLFAQARKHMPCIVFIDEIDAVGSKRVADMGGGSEERNQTLNQLLTELDGFSSDGSSIVVIAATNRSDALDPALLRPGRFDKHVEVPLPMIKAREEILRVHAKNVKMDPSVDLAIIARGTPGFSGASLAHLINEAALIATKKGQETITVMDLEEARDKVLLGRERRSYVMTPEEIKATAYHEAGHSLIRLLFPYIDPLHKVTILPRSQSLGISFALPEDDRLTHSKDEMLANIMVAMGGRAAEEVVFNKISTGASNDFEKATDTARKMVCVYGMTEELGPVSYTGDFRYSQHTAQQIDDTVRIILKDAYAKAKQMLTENREKLEKLAQALLERETLYADEVYELLGMEPRESHRWIKP